MKQPIVYSVIVFFLTLYLTSCAEKEQVAKAPPTEEDTKQAFVLKKQSVGKALKLPAELLPYERAEMNARVEGFVRKVMVDIGDKVKEGQVLAVLEAPEAVARYAEATARQQEAKARYMGSLDRFQRLSAAAKEEGVIAQSELVNAKNQMLADSAAIASAQSTAQVYRQLQDYLTVKAPFAGVITSRTIDPGDLVGSGAASQPLYTVEQTDRLRLRVHVPEAYVNSIPTDEPLSFTTNAVVSKTFEADLSRKSGRIDPATRTELWEYEYENTSGALKPGMYTTAQFNLKRENESFVVPYTAVATTLERKFIVRANNGKVAWVDVRQGISMNDGVEIFGELTEGDTLLIRGSEEIKADSTINVKI